VLAVGLLDVTLRDAHGCDVRVPHLLSLFHPTSVFGSAPRISVEVTVSAHPLRRNLQDTLREQIAGLGDDPEIDLISIDPHGVRLRVSIRTADPATRALLQARLLEVVSSDRPVRPPPGVSKTT
jgi:hypothetical protein